MNINCAVKYVADMFINEFILEGTYYKNRVQEREGDENWT